MDMDNNPWEVDSIETFSHFKCPECSFLTKNDHFFQDHAIENHPLSFALFSEKLHDGDVTKMVKTEILEDDKVMDFDNHKIFEMNGNIGEHFMLQTEKMPCLSNEISDPLDCDSEFKSKKAKSTRTKVVKIR